jgi:hypothetical protein
MHGVRLVHSDRDVRFSMKRYDAVRVKFLAAQAERKGWNVNARAPRVGDVGTVVEILSAAGQAAQYVVECVAPDGTTLWLADFTAEELEVVERPAP